jgi:polyisoprenoid-binding protein YceI
MRFKTAFISVFVLGLMAVNGVAQEKYDIDASHSNVNFTVRHMVVSKVSGGFKEFSGAILYDEKDISKSSVNVTIKTASVNTQNERRDTHLRSADFFDAENNPDITFVSKKIEKRNDGHVAIGDFTMRGVTKEIELPFTILGKQKTQRGTVMGIEAKTTLNRFDYGVKWDRALDDGGLVVGKDVEITLTVEALAPSKAQ